MLCYVHICISLADWCPHGTSWCLHTGLVFNACIVFYRSLQGNRLTGRIPEVIGLMQALAVLWVKSEIQNFNPLLLVSLLVHKHLSKFVSQRPEREWTGWADSSYTWQPILHWQTVSIINNALRYQPYFVLLIVCITIIVFSYLHGNKLTGQIPPELGNMSKLSYL